MNPAKTDQPPHKPLRHNKMATSLLRSCRGSHPSIVFPREYSHQHVSREKETDGDPPQQGSAASHRGGQTHTVPVWKACNGPHQVCEILEEDCLPTDKQQPKTLSSSIATPTFQLPMGVVPSKETAMAEKGAIALTRLASRNTRQETAELTLEHTTPKFVSAFPEPVLGLSVLENILPYF